MLRTEQGSFAIKIKAIICLFFSGVILVRAQSTNKQPSLSPNTNLVTAASWFREVNGQLYNTEKSERFTSISAECEAVESRGIVAHWIMTKPIYDKSSYGGVSRGNYLYGGTETVKVGEETVFDKRIFVQNYPPQRVAEGQKLNFRAIKIGVTNYNSRTIELWDYGTPHQVQISSTNLIHAVNPLANYQSHSVKVGDTLTTIARKYGVSVKSILSANNLRDTRIQIGQILIIPNQ